jgi:hypothetical protein
MIIVRVPGQFNPKTVEKYQRVPFYLKKTYKNKVKNFSEPKDIY